MGERRDNRLASCLYGTIFSLVVLVLLLPCLSAEEKLTEGLGPGNGHFGSGSETIDTISVDSRKLIYVSTLDGKLSALDGCDEGRLLWSVPADNRPLLSSSISQLEIMEKGVSTRYIPSLDGGLYRYDGDSIHPVPLTAEKLLSATHKLSEDTMMVGGKDVLTYGLNPHTGQVRYVCSVKGCRAFGEQIDPDEDVLVITRQTQTVRAVDSRSGAEKWNYSVGQHEVTFKQGRQTNIEDYTDSDYGKQETEDVYCALDDEEDPYETMDIFSSTVKIVVPDGMVVGVSPDNLQSVTWTHKFKSPISNVWLLLNGELQQIDLFDNQNIPALSSFNQDAPIHQPLLYVGMHDKQLYVQQSAEMKEKMMMAAEEFQEENDPPGSCSSQQNLPRVAWKPYLNTAQWRTPSMNHRRPQIEGNGEPGSCEGPEDNGALVIWHENYPFDNGFYLYPEFSLTVPMSDTENDNCEMTGSCEGNQSHETTIYDDVMAVPVTLWNWWKEVIAISVLTSIAVNVILNRVHQAHAAIVQHSSSSQSLSESGSGNKEQSVSNADSDPSLASRQNSDEYVSRYETDYEHIHVLGKGGFGVVFEAANKVDECHYAIKRIALPNSDGAKEKVMREVKALAKLDHVGIVRYFHTWIESPPPGWQEEKDLKVEYSEGLTTPTFSQMTSATPSQPTSNTPPKFDLSSFNGFVSQKPAKLSPNAVKNLSPVMKPSPLDFLKNPLGGNILEISESEMKRGSSEEFSVHNITESGWGNDDGEESGSYSGMGTPNFPAPIDDSVDISFRHEDDSLNGISIEKDSSRNNNCSKNSANIPFSYHDLSDSISKSHDHIIPIEDSNCSFQIVFEDSGCGDKSSKGSIEDVSVEHPPSQSVAASSNISGSSENCTCPKTHQRTNSNSKSHVRTHSRGRSLGQPSDFANILPNSDKKSTDKDKNETEQTSISGHRPKLFLYIQMQLCRRETLKDWLASNTLNRDRHTVLDMFDQITSAIEYVHDCGLMHRDLKPSNIFFSVDGVIKMGDFGLVTALPEEQNEGLGSGNPFKKHTAQVGTQLYMSPEQMTGKKYSAKVDIFSLGVILFELLYPFATQMERVNTLVRVKQQVFPERFNREMVKEAKFVSWLLSYKPEDRPSAKDILASELLHEFENRRMPRRFRSRTVSQNSN